MNPPALWPEIAPLLRRVAAWAAVIVTVAALLVGCSTGGEEGHDRPSITGDDVVAVLTSAVVGIGHSAPQSVGAPAYPPL